MLRRYPVPAFLLFAPVLAVSLTCGIRETIAKNCYSPKLRHFARESGVSWAYRGGRHFDPQKSMIYKYRGRFRLRCAVSWGCACGFTVYKDDRLSASQLLSVSENGRYRRKELEYVPCSPTGASSPGENVKLARPLPQVAPEKMRIGGRFATELGPKILHGANCGSTVSHQRKRCLLSCENCPVSVGNKS